MLCSVDVDPSPKSQLNVVASVDVLTKVTSQGAALLSPVTVNIATGYYIGSGTTLGKTTSSLHPTNTNGNTANNNKTFFIKSDFYS